MSTSSPAESGLSVPSFADFSGSPASFVDKWDIAALNLICASDLPGSENLNVGRSLARVDECAETVGAGIDDNYKKFTDNPGLFRFSQAYFCAVTMITVLQRKCGVRYNPEWLHLTPDSEMPASFGEDSKNIFIHGIIDGPGGTCGSLPVFYAAVGRRRGYPLKLVKAKCHMFVRWDDPNGDLWGVPEVFNIEATCQGLRTPLDEEYRTWPHPIEQEEVDSGLYLTSLSKQEECAEFLGMRGRMLLVHDRPLEALKVYGCAAELFPKNPYFKRIYDFLKQELTVVVSSGSYYIWAQLALL